MSLYAPLNMIIDLKKQLEERIEILEQKLELLAVKIKNYEEKIPRKRKYFKTRRPNKKFRGDLRCWICNQLGHYLNNCLEKKKNNEVKTVVLKYVPIIRELIVKEENPKN